ncbi:FecR domain-containing protein [Paraflavitalea sp. CAU 1676]|uniref:FecR family protein n=1 Tax=Paraflavitalea sp. CAU 1676 TaxID=3032598 RepID=UPI0023DBB345|nr:FecR domain-containing protein [Paraflavitalea sp. CAU 1676]MDF2193384.1 FecR domain-containing protein [Paraflavitalea sp. CAU 1676]
MEQSFSTVEDIIADEDFQAWYLAGNETARQSWETRIAADPALRPLVQEASQYMDALVIKEQGLPIQQINAAEQRLMDRLSTAPAAPVVPMKRNTSRWWWAAAAAIVLVTAGLYVFNSRLAKPSSMQTAYGEIRKQQLPDGSTVMLNANSEISYHNGFEKGSSREVWLKGEAFFHVAKTPSKARFIVHTDRFDVVVTGTQFNVMNRAGKTNVMLTEGSVTLQLRNGQEIKMKPGDFVDINDQQPDIKTAKEENILAWKEKKLYFEKTPLRTAAHQIEELYGVKITLADDEIGDRLITGIMMNDNLDVLLKALETAFELQVEVRENKEIIISDSLSDKGHTPARTSKKVTN